MTRKPFVGTVKEADKYLQDNEYIIRGYRIGFNSKRTILRSLFMVHNESVNIWSMLIGLLLFFGLIAYTFNYLAPPSIHGNISDPITHRWMTDSSIMKKRTESLYNDIIS